MNNPENILYPVGHHAVGKTELCDYLVDQYGFHVVETGAMVRSLYTNREQKYSHLSLGEFVERAESDHPLFFDKQLVHRVQALDQAEGRVIVNGMRSYTNIERAVDAAPDITHSIVWMDADFNLLHDRYNTRENKSISAEEFADLLEFDLELGLADIKARADYSIENNSSVERLRADADAIMRNLGITALKSF